MSNPFKALGNQPLENPKGEEVGGAFSCEECHAVMNTARYMDEISVLSWKCTECGHISKIEGFHID